VANKTSKPVYFPADLLAQLDEFLKTEKGKKFFRGDSKKATVHIVRIFLEHNSNGSVKFS